jgi:N-acetylmuramoyl-L-alanine amidase
MIRRTHWAAAVFLIVPVCAAPNSGIIQVTGLRSWSHPGSTRVIVETSGPAEYRTDRAQSPDRLFIDILHSRPWIDHRRVATRQIDDHLVKRVRIAETAPEVTRIVFDLNGSGDSRSIDFKVSRLDTPDRLVVELTPAGAKSQISAKAVGSQVPAGSPSRANTLRPQAARVSAPTAPAAHWSFAPMPPPRHIQPVIRIPAEAPAIELGALTPYPMPEAWTLLANVTMPRKPGTATNPAANAPFVNTTTRVLPATRPAVPATAARASTDASQSLTRALGLKINRIVIDAGHGGHDDGTIGPNGVLEKDVVLDVALRLASLVQTRLGAEVVLTRSDDTFVPLTERTAIANEHKADLFLSIHANSSPAPSVAGTETFLLNLNSSPGAIATAARENAGSDKSVGELRDLVQSIALNDKIAESQSFAANIQSSIFTQAAKANAAARDRGVKKAPFVVLIGARMPSVLAEIGFLSNARDESNLNKPEYRQKIAESLYRGISQYSQSLSHFEVAGGATKPTGFATAAAK